VTVLFGIDSTVIGIAGQFNCANVDAAELRWAAVMTAEGSRATLSVGRYACDKEVSCPPEKSKSDGK
jgi:hypothetical protein